MGNKRPQAGSPPTQKQREWGIQGKAPWWAGNEKNSGHAPSRAQSTAETVRALRVGRVMGKRRPNQPPTYKTLRACERECTNAPIATKRPQPPVPKTKVSIEVLHAPSTLPHTIAWGRHRTLQQTHARECSKDFCHTANTAAAASKRSYEHNALASTMPSRRARYANGECTHRAMHSNRRTLSRVRALTFPRWGRYGNHSKSVPW